MNILVLQLGKPAEIFSAVPMIRILEKKGHSVYTAVWETYREAAEIIFEKDRLIPLASGTGEDAEDSFLQSATRAISEKIENMDLLLNLTFTELGAKLATRLNSKNRTGMMYGSNNDLLIPDPWSQYIFSQVLSQNFNTLHFIDLYKRIARVEAEATDLLGVDRAERNPRKSVCIQRIASHTDQTISSPAWNDLLEKLSDRFDSTIDLDQLSWVNRYIALKDASRLVTTSFDSAILASLLEVPTVFIHFGNIRVKDLGPYNVKSGKDACSHDILFINKKNAASVPEAVEAILKNIDVPVRVPHAVVKGRKCTAGVFVSHVAPKNFQQEDLHRFFEDAFYLLAEFRNSGRHEDLEVPKFNKKKNSIDLLEKTFDSICLLRRLAEYGVHYLGEILKTKADKVQLEKMMDKYIDVEKQFLELQKSVPFIKPLIDTWKVSKETSLCLTLEFEEVLEIAQSAYRELIENTEIVIQLMETAVEATHKKSNSAERLVERNLKGRELE
ncbi:MAG: hypothetical protein AB7F43_02845 [Bacteriovoracia bacterium]